MNKIEKMLINIVPFSKWRKILRKELQEDLYEKVFGDLTKTMEPCIENCKLGEKYNEIFGIKFSPMQNCYGIAESFGRRDYEFGGVNNTIFIDVGANIGDSALYAATQKNIQKIYAYEPFPNTYKTALQNINLNSIYKNKIELFDYGWGKENKHFIVKGNNDINLSAGNSTQEDFISKNIQQYANDSQVVIKKSSEILKQILNKHSNHNIILKMDIEGSEYEVLEDLKNADLLKYISIIILEWHLNGYDEIVEKLEQNNFIWFNEIFFHNIGLIRAVNLKPQKYIEKIK